MSDLADAVLPLIRTRAELWRWSVFNAHGDQMRRAVGILAAAIGVEDPATVLAVTQKAIASSMAVIMRADDSSGIIGDACQALLDMHPGIAALAQPPTAKLVDWMIRFQFNNECDYFHLDPVAYAPALGETGMKTYRKKLAELADNLGPRPAEIWAGHEWATLHHNEQRLAVYDRDIDAIIRTHARDRRVAVWLEDTAEALEEIGEIDLAIEWAQQAVDFPGGGHQSMKASDYLCRLLAEHRPKEVLPARLSAFQLWPSSSTAAHLFREARGDWPQYEQAVMATLATQPRDAVLFAQLTLKDIPLAWELAHSLGRIDDRTWSDLVKAYEKIDPIATLPVHEVLVVSQLEVADAQNYRLAARRLARMRKLALDTPHAADTDALIAELREIHKRRPRLQQEFTRAGLP